MNHRQSVARRGEGGFVSKLKPAHVLSALVAFVFAVTGPIAVMLTVGVSGNMPAHEIASWMFGAFTINGLISVGFCLWYRQPLVFLWSIPGIVLVGNALEHLSFSEIVGAYLLTGVLIFGLGVSGWLKRVAAWLPMPIVMGMVAGVFLQFAVSWIGSFEKGFQIAAPMTAAYFACAAWRSLAAKVPPVIAALIAGFVAMAVTGGAPAADAVVFELITPTFFVPTFSWAASIELVVPLAITVLFVQNNQGIALLRNAGHEPPVSAITAFCGLGALVSGIVGTVPTCLSGPVNGIISEDDDRTGHYTAGVLVAVMLGLFGMLAPLFTTLILAAPNAFIATLGGIALLKVLQGSFRTAFEGRLSMGGLIAFVVTVSDISFFNIGAPFWGLVFGVAVSWALETEDAKAALRRE